MTPPSSSAGTATPSERRASPLSSAAAYKQPMVVQRCTRSRRTAAGDGSDASSAFARVDGVSATAAPSTGAGRAADAAARRQASATCGARSLPSREIAARVGRLAQRQRQLQSIQIETPRFCAEMSRPRFLQAASSGETAVVARCCATPTSTRRAKRVAQRARGRREQPRHEDALWQDAARVRRERQPPRGDQARATFREARLRIPSAAKEVATPETPPAAPRRRHAPARSIKPPGQSDDEDGAWDSDEEGDGGRPT